MTDKTEPPIAHTLKPCPFCGYQAATVEGNERFYVVCRNPECYAALGEIYDAYAMPEHHFATSEEAVAAWNTRVTPTPDRGLIDKLEEEASTTHSGTRFIWLDKAIKIIRPYLRTAEPVSGEKSEYEEHPCTTKGRTYTPPIPTHQPVECDCDWFAYSDGTPYQRHRCKSRKQEAIQPVEERLIHAERVMDALYHDLDNAVYSIWGCEAEHHRPATEPDYQEYKRVWGIGRKGDIVRLRERESGGEATAQSSVEEG